MPPSLEFHPEAIEEAAAARRWYAERSGKAESGFVQELDRAVESILEAPERWPRYEGDTRRFLMRRYPFSVVYRVADDRVLVLAVAHAKRRPGYWRER